MFKMLQKIFWVLKIYLIKIKILILYNSTVFIPFMIK